MEMEIDSLITNIYGVSAISQVLFKALGGQAMKKGKSLLSWHVHSSFLGKTRKALHSVISTKVVQIQRAVGIRSRGL